MDAIILADVRYRLDRVAERAETGPVVVAHAHRPGNIRNIRTRRADRSDRKMYEEG